MNRKDFRYPQNVAKEAKESLQKELENRNYDKVLRSALDLTLAEILIDPEKINREIAFLDSLSKEIPAPYSHLALLMEAQMYCSYYEENSYEYNDRKLPLNEEWPENISEWSEEMFAVKVFDIVSKVTENEKNIKPNSGDLENLKNLFSLEGFNITEKDKLLHSFTLQEFIYLKSAGLLNNFIPNLTHTEIPFYPASKGKEKNISEKCLDKSISLYEEVIEKGLNKKENYVAAYAMLQMLRIENNLDVENFMAGVSRLEHTPGLGLFLSGAYGSLDEESCYKICKEWLKEFPNTLYSQSVEYIINQIAEGFVNLKIPNYALPDEKIKGTATLKNINRIYLHLYRADSYVTEPDLNLNFDQFEPKSLVEVITVSAEGEKPFEKEVEFELPALEEGFYVVLPYRKDKLSSDWKKEVERWSFGYLNISRISAFTTGTKTDSDGAKIYVVNASNQEPVKGAKIKVYSYLRDGKILSKGTTGSDGSFPINDDNGMCVVTFGNSRIKINSNIGYDPQAVSTGININILTDLKVYREGDVVKFVGIAWQKDTLGYGAPVPEADLTFRLMDSNYEKLDSIRVFTDKNGRCTGNFTLPKGILLGTYTIEGYESSSKGLLNKSRRFHGFYMDGVNIGTARIEVSEYKLPGFLVSFRQIESSADSIRFEGEVKTYSGMSVPGAVINYTVNYMPYRFYSRYMPDASYTDSLESDDEGKFSFELPLENLKNTPFEKGSFMVSLTATAPDGDTQTANPVNFYLGNILSIYPDIEELIEINTESIELKVEIKDQAGNSVEKRVEYSISDLDGKKLLSGAFTSPTLKIDSYLIPSGKYQIKFDLPQDSIESIREIAFYRNSDKTPPFKTPLWLPETQIIAKKGETEVYIPFGTAYENSWIYYAIKQGKEIIKEDWIKVDGVNACLTIKAPQGYETVSVLFNGLHDFENTSGNVSITSEWAHRNFTIEVETMREKITAGDKEKWKFKIKRDDSVKMPVYCSAVMTDKALNAIFPFRWNFSPILGIRYSPPYISVANRYDMHIRANYLSEKGSSMSVRILPEWDTYGYPLNGNLNYYGNALLYSSFRPVHDELETIEEEAEVETPRLSKMMEKRSITADDAVAGSIEEEENSNENDKYDDVSLRESECPVAFFMPCLTTDDNGNLEIEFEVPDFNTTWQFQISGYNDEMLTGFLMKDVNASKPVMAKCNFPKFLRTGDKTVIQATLYNALDRQQQVGGKFEIINPFTGNVIKSVEFSPENVAANSSRIIDMEYEVGDDLSQIEIRVYAKAENHSDGEKQIVAVYPDSSPVIESYQIYMGNGEWKETIDLPNFKEDANVTFRYYTDPYWQLMLDLPSISIPENTTSLLISQALYANCMGRNVGEEFPSMRERLLKFISENKKIESTLESDSSLKLLGIRETPWVNNSEAEKVRMMNLASLLDKSHTDEAIRNLVNELLKLQNPDGGWSWCPGMKSSDFITREVLFEIAEMRRSGSQPEGLENAISKAIGYCDNNLLKEIKKYGKTGDLYMLEYLYIRSFFKELDMNEELKKITDNFISKICKDPVNLSMRYKAELAIVLKRNGMEQEARDELESISQYLTKDNRKGWYFANMNSGLGGWERLLSTSMALNAFVEIEPDSEAVKGLRQWLLLQKETEDWGDNNLKVQIIQSILASGNNPGEAIASPTLEIGSRNVSLPTGENNPILTINLVPEEISGKELTVAKTTEPPAYGGLICQYVAPINEIAAQPCENLSIRKQMVKLSPSGEAISADGILKVGDRVRVTLTVVCEKDMDYVAIVDGRGGCLQPEEWLSGFGRIGEGWGYIETRDNRTSLFFEFLPKGTHIFTYDCFADREGEYSSGIANIQSLYSPQQAAHSAGNLLKVNR